MVGNGRDSLAEFLNNTHSLLSFSRSTMGVKWSTRVSVFLTKVQQVIGPVLTIEYAIGFNDVDIRKASLNVSNHSIQVGIIQNTEASEFFLHHLTECSKMCPWGALHIL